MSRKIETGQTPRIDSQVFQQIKSDRGLGNLSNHHARFVMEKNPGEEMIHTVESRQKELALAKK